MTAPTRTTTRSRRSRPAGRRAPTTNASVYERVTEQILQAMDRGVLPWNRPWSTVGGGLPHNAVTRRPYHGVNVLALWMTQLARGYSASGWLTFQQAKRAGGHVRKGEHGTPVVLLRPITKRETDAETGAERERQIWLARQFTVFNVEQIDGLPERYAVREPGRLIEPVAACESAVAATGADIRHGGNVACYSPAGDYILMPERGRFVSAGDYYATLFHELGHWTGHPTRLDRSLSTRFGSADYALEELVAELTAAFLSARFGFDHVSQASSYLDHWRRAARADVSAIVAAASAASKAADYLVPAPLPGEAPLGDDAEEEEGDDA